MGRGDKGGPLSATKPPSSSGGQGLVLIGVGLCPATHSHMQDLKTSSGNEEGVPDGRGGGSHNENTILPSSPAGCPPVEKLGAEGLS